MEIRKSNTRYAKIGTCIILIVICLILLLCKCSSQEDFTEASTTSQSVGIVSTSSIAIPGYEGITLKANTKRQDVCLANPSSNQCVFRVTLCLEDGTILWESDEILPGEKSKPIKLKQKLEEGTYPKAKLQYACFKMNEERTPLNGAETVLTLRV